jgi:hypothetical protein
MLKKCRSIGFPENERNLVLFVTLADETRKIQFLLVTTWHFLDTLVEYAGDRSDIVQYYWMNEAVRFKLKPYPDHEEVLMP